MWTWPQPLLEPCIGMDSLGPEPFSPPQMSQRSVAACCSPWAPCHTDQRQNGPGQLSFPRSAPGLQSCGQGTISAYPHVKPLWVSVEAEYMVRLRIAARVIPRTSLGAQAPSDSCPLRLLTSGVWCISGGAVRGYREKQRENNPLFSFPNMFSY